MARYDERELERTASEAASQLSKIVAELQEVEDALGKLPDLKRKERELQREKENLERILKQNRLKLTEALEEAGKKAA